MLLGLNNHEIPAGESKVGKRTLLQIWMLKIICMVVNFAAVDIHEKLNCTVLIIYWVLIFSANLAILSLLKCKDSILC